MSKTFLPQTLYKNKGMHDIDLLIFKSTNSRAFLLQEVHIPRLITPAEKGRDLEPRAMDAYIIQCQAEAQEGTEAPRNLH